MTDRRGHIKISRKFFEEDPWWNQRRTFSKAEAWLDFLHLAAYRSRIYVTSDGPIPLDRGQLVASYRYLASRWRWSVKMVRTWCQTGIAGARIRAHRETPAGTVYSIVNYDYYQAGGTAAGTPEGTPEGTDGAHLGHSKGTRKKQVKQVSSKAGNTNNREAIAGASQMWAASRGEPPYARIGNAMKRLIPKHGQRQVLLAWEGYLEDRRDKGFCTPEDFAGSYELYRRKWAVEIGEDGSETPVPSEPEAAA